MMRLLLEMTGVVGPRMDGLDDVLSDVASGRLLPDDAATQIRSMAGYRESLVRKVVVWMPVFGGAVFFVVGIAFGIANYLSVANALPATGNVTRLVHGKTHFKFVVDGVTYSGESWIQSESPDHSVGEEIRVLYRPENPAKARIDSFVELWLFPTVFPLVGLFSMIGGGVTHLVLKRYA